MEVVASLSQGRTAAAQCGLFTHKSVPAIFEPPCIFILMYHSIWRDFPKYEHKFTFYFLGIGPYIHFKKKITDLDKLFVVNRTTLTIQFWKLLFFE